MVNPSTIVNVWHAGAVVARVPVPVRPARAPRHTNVLVGAGPVTREQRGTWADDAVVRDAVGEPPELAGALTRG